MHLQIIRRDYFLVVIRWPNGIDDGVAGVARAWMRDQEAQNIKLKRREIFDRLLALVDHTCGLIEPDSAANPAGQAPDKGRQQLTVDAPGRAIPVTAAL